MGLRKTKVLALAGAAAGVLALGISAASASPASWTVKAGNAPAGTSVGFSGVTQGSTPQIVLNDTTSNLQLTCDSGSAAGHTTAGTGLTGVQIATVTGNSTTWQNCVGPLGLVLNPVGSGTWKIDSTYYNAKTGVSNGSLYAAHAVVSTADGTSCVFTVKGTAPITFDNTSQTLTVLPTKANLVISGVTGCFGLINNNDRANFSATYKIAPKFAKYGPVTITAP